MLERELKQKLVLFAKEDIAGLDVTTDLLKEETTAAKIVANETCILAGIEEVSFLFSHFGAKIVFAKKDGSAIKSGETILRVVGSNKKILSVERTALNVLGRMSGVATICAQASKVAGNKTKIFLTRKTMPGLNSFDKKACVFGGVHSHRKNLREAILIKENHLEFGSISNLLQKAFLQKKKLNLKEVEIEVQGFEESFLAAINLPDAILLDNFSAKNAKKAIQLIRQVNKKIQIELSGGINLKNLKSFVNLGADRISMGELTKSAKMADFSLEIAK